MRAEDLDLLYMLFCKPGGASVMRRRGFPLQLQALRGKQEEKQKILVQFVLDWAVQTLSD